MLDKNFFKFLLGFLAIIGLGLLGVFAAHAYSDSGINIGDLIANFFR